MTVVNSRVCVYAPAGVYSVTPLNPAKTNSGAFTRNGCIEGDGHLQTIFHVRPNTGGDLFAWYNAQGNILLLNVDQAGPACRGFAVEGDRTSNVDQNALTFYGLNDYILCTDVEVDYLLGSALRCGDTLTSLPSDPTFCRESHFRDLRFTRTGDGTTYPVIMFDSQNNSDGDNNLDLSDIDIYNPRGTGMLITDHAGTRGNSSHNIAMARIRWEGSEASVASITTDLLRIEGGNAGTAHVTCSGCRWENPYLGAAAIHLTANTLVMPAVTPSDIVLDGRVINSTGFGRGVAIDGGNNLLFNFSILTSADYNLYIPVNAKLGNDVFINGYGAEANWTYSIDPGSVAALLGPLQRVAGATGSSVQAVLPTAVRGCTALRGLGTVDLQTDCSTA